MLAPYPAVAARSVARKSVMRAGRAKSRPIDWLSCAGNPTPFAQISRQVRSCRTELYTIWDMEVHARSSPQNVCCQSFPVGHYSAQTSSLCSHHTTYHRSPPANPPCHNHLHIHTITGRVFGLGSGEKPGEDSMASILMNSAGGGASTHRNPLEPPPAGVSRIPPYSSACSRLDTVIVIVMTVGYRSS